MAKLEWEEIESSFSNPNQVSSNWESAKSEDAFVF